MLASFFLVAYVACIWQATELQPPTFLFTPLTAKPKLVCWFTVVFFTHTAVIADKSLKTHIHL